MAGDAKRSTEPHARREALGRAAFAHARARWDPAKTEAVYVSIYRELLEKKGRA